MPGIVNGALAFLHRIGADAVNHDASGLDKSTCGPEELPLIIR